MQPRLRPRRVGERWSLLIVRELSLGPLRFSDLARDVGGAPTDVLTKRLRDLEGDGVVVRRELTAPSLDHRLRADRARSRPRAADDRAARAGAWSCRRPTTSSGWRPPRCRTRCAWSCGRRPRQASTSACAAASESFALRARDGWIAASRGAAGEPDLTLSGTPIEVLAAVVSGPAGVPGVEVEGDTALLDELATMVVVPERLRDEAQMLVESGGLLIAAAEATAATS